MSACTRCRGELEHGDLRCAICALAVPSMPPTERSRYAQVLRCTECNAAVAFAPAAGAPTCAFCGATMVIEQPVDPVEAAELRVPFTVDRTAAITCLRGWLDRRGWFTPRALSREAVVEHVQPLCWAGWLVHGRAEVAWTADSDAGARRSDWAPHAGHLTLTFDGLVVPASRGLAHHECARLAPHYDHRRAVPVDAPEIPGEPPAVVESFDTQRSAARALVRRGIEADAAARVEPHIPGRRFRRIRVACLLEQQTTRRVALPAWVFAYRYRGSAYRAIVHGQRGDLVIGATPLDWAKVALVVAAALAVLLAILAVSLR